MHLQAVNELSGFIDGGGNVLDIAGRLADDFFARTGELARSLARRLVSWARSATWLMLTVISSTVAAMPEGGFALLMQAVATWLEVVDIWVAAEANGLCRWRWISGCPGAEALPDLNLSNT